MAGTVTPKKPTPKEKGYNIAGDTLADIWKDIEKKGPKIKGKNRAGRTTAEGDANPNYTYKVKEVKGEQVCDLWTDVVKVTLVNALIEFPKLKSDKKLSPKAKAEWKRFFKELMAHEREHVATMMAEMKALGSEVVNVAKTTKDADKQKAIDAAVEQWSTDVTALIGKAKIIERLAKVNDGLDSKSGHGPVLNTSIP